jgi:hypothetical protein
VDEALGALRQSIQQADGTEDRALRVSVRYGLGFSLYVAGLLGECLAVVEEGLELARDDLDLGADRLGFSPSLGLLALKARVLTLAGSPQEGGVELDRVVELARASRQPSLPTRVRQSGGIIYCRGRGGRDG